MAAVVTALQSCMQSFKSILTTPDFGVQYEVLCTELSLQWLRIRLWGDSAGLTPSGTSSLQTVLSSNQVLEQTITQSMSMISFILQEIEVLRRRFEVKPRLLPAEPQKPALRSSRSMNALSEIHNLPGTAQLRQRMQDNQDQKSVVALAKWSMREAKKFEELVGRLKSLIDGLEQVSKAAGIMGAPAFILPLAQSVPNHEESPPPYSLSPTPRTTPLRPAPPASPPLSSPPISRPTHVPIAEPDADLLPHHAALKSYLFAFPCNASQSSPSSSARQKLVNLSNVQLQELREDVYDELIRRQTNVPSYTHLPENQTYRPKRNQARKKLSGLAADRFGWLVEDLREELERRWVFLREDIRSRWETAPSSGSGFSSSGNTSTSPRTPMSPPPRLRDRARHHSTLLTSHPSAINSPPTSPIPFITHQLNFFPAPSSPPRNNHPPPLLMSPPPPRGILKSSRPPLTIPTPPKSKPSNGSIEIFKSFRVSMDDPTSKVLPAALRKYNITANWEDYDLVLIYKCPCVKASISCNGSASTSTSPSTPSSTTSSSSTSSSTNTTTQDTRENKNAAAGTGGCSCGNGMKDIEWVLQIDEKPLLMFKRFDKEGRKPMFMLRKKRARVINKQEGEL